MARSGRDVFINCPFDTAYKPLFIAAVFTIIRSGYRARCALEADDAAENRFEKICRIIKECRFGVHDISRTECDGKPPLPRFNMLLELGVFIGAKRYGGADQNKKRCIIFDRERFRFQKYISDIAGQDIHSHKRQPKTLIIELATWLRMHGRDKKVPGGQAIATEFKKFNSALPGICSSEGLAQEELGFDDYNSMIIAYVTKGAGPT